MRRKLEITPYDVVDYLTNEELVRTHIAGMRKIADECIKGSIEDGRRACARYGLSLAAAGLAGEEEALAPSP